MTAYRAHGLRCLENMCLACLIYELAEECERDDLWLVRDYGDGTTHGRNAALLLRGLLEQAEVDA